MNDTIIDLQEDELQNTISDVFSEAEEVRDNNSSRNPALAVPLAAFRFVTRLASGIFSRGQKNSEPASLDIKGEGEGEGEVQVHHEDESETSEGKDYGNDCNSQRSIVIDSCDTDTRRKGEELAATGTSETLDTAETVCNLRIEGPDTSEFKEVDNFSFKRFDIATDPLDHYFLGTNAQVIHFFLNYIIVISQHRAVIINVKQWI